MPEFKKGDRVKIIRWAVNNESRMAEADRQQLVGKIGTVIDAGMYISVLLDHDPAYVHASVIAVESELEHYADDADQAQSA